jgi:hypothetical protein
MIETTYNKSRYDKIKIIPSTVSDKRVTPGTVLDDGHVVTKKARKTIDITGCRFGKLVGVRPLSHTKSHGLNWLLHCDCGEDVIRAQSRLNGVSSCGCGILVGGCKKGYAVNYLYRSYKYSAIKRGYAFELTDMEFRLLTSGECYYCGSMPNKIRKSKHGDYVYNGIDRVDNEDGYVAYNCVPCCYRCNIAKGDDSVQDFLHLIESIHQNVYKFDKSLRIS